jgi:hypothetical protein|nr:MAG TPA: Flagellar and Swarming motility protein [Caudoviricetes sp.]
MFIRLTFNYRVLYINTKYIEGFRTLIDHTKIWLSSGEVIEVEESPDEILKLIEEARNHGNQG